MTILDLPLVLVQLVPLHLGALHPVERALTLVLAFGPFVVLGVVVWWRSRHDEAETDVEEPAQRDR